MIPGLSDAATAEDGLAKEAALFAAAAPGAMVWTSRAPALVCPAAYERKPGFAAAQDASYRNGWPLVLRRSGGGVVPQGPGVINLVIAATFARGFTIEDGYRLLARAIRDGLGENGSRLDAGATEGSFCDGAWNLSFQGRKIAGLAQHWRPRPESQVRILAHAMILSHGPIRPSVRAVDAVHSALGLPDVRVEAHTSLEAAFGQDQTARAALPGQLLAAATAAVR